VEKKTKRTLRSRINKGLKIPRVYQNQKEKLIFVIQKGTYVVPIEVKVEENLKAKSLRGYCDKYNSQLAIMTFMSCYREQSWMVNMPLWTISQF